MNQIFYSQVDPNLQEEMLRRAKAGKSDRSETALRYMTEKIANAELIAYDGNRRDDAKIVDRLGGDTVLSGEFLPGGDYGFLSKRDYTLKDTRFVASVSNNSVTVTEDTKSTSKNNTSYRIPPFITTAELAINDNTRGLTNKATINITIPNPDRDLNFMESVYARPGRYCRLTIAHPETALMTRQVDTVYGMLSSGSMPDIERLKKYYPDAVKHYDQLRKMNQVQFEGLITSFEYQYNQDGSISMTVYILGTSMVYTDLSMIMQTGTTEEIQASGSNFVIDQAKSFYQAIRDEILALHQQKYEDPNTQVKDAFGIQASINTPTIWLSGYKGIDGNINAHINLNYLIDFLNRKILSKVSDVVESPTIYCSSDFGVRSNYYDALCSSDPENILLGDHNIAPNADTSPDCYGKLNSTRGKVPRKWFPSLDLLSGIDLPNDPIKPSFYPTHEEIKASPESGMSGRPGHIFINLRVIESIVNDLAGTKDAFTVKSFLERISSKINSATGGAINMQLTADPMIPNELTFRDTNWIFAPSNPKPKPFIIPMFANNLDGTVVRDFKLSAKRPSNVQSLMYSINNSDKVTEDQVAPYMNFMYNNAAVKRSGAGNAMVETSTYGDAELTRKLAEQYLETHKKYKSQLEEARAAYGADPANEQKRIALASALKKHIQYPKPTVEQSNQLAAPVFPIDAEFTIDGINGFRYGDIVDFPGIPEKYRRQTTFTIKGISHSVTEAGEWTTKISCMMRPRFD